ncbi:hypothetical protein MMPV_002027 [Pyropia vietnamensis]
MPQILDGAAIAVMGATRGQGAAVAAALVAQHRFHVRALTRNAQSASATALAAAPRTSVVEVADATDATSLATAFAGVAGVDGSRGGVDVVTDEAMGRAAVAAAAATPSVMHVVVSSACDVEVDIPHFQSKLRVEEALKAAAATSHFTYTLLRPTLFMDNWAPGGTTPITAGTVPGLAAPDVPVKVIAVADIGRVAAMAFGNPSAWANRIISLAGDNVSGTAVAATVARVRGKGETFAYVPIPREGLREAAPALAQMADFFDAPGYTDAALAQTREVLPDVLSLEAWLEASPLKGGELPTST